MSITCALSDSQIEKLFKLTYKKMKDALDSNQEFDVNLFMDDIFKKIAEKENVETAAKFVQQIPAMVYNLLGKKALLDLDADSTSIRKLNKQFKSETGINDIIKTFSTDSAEELRRKIKEKEDAENNIPIESTSDQPVILLPTRFKAGSAASGTIQSFVKVDPKRIGTNKEIIIETIDPELETTINVLNTIDTLKNITVPGEDIKYQGKALKLKVFDFTGFEKNYPTLIRESDKGTIVQGNTIDKQGNAKVNVIPVKERVLLVVTDDNGNILYFDKNGNITDEANGTIVYQFLRTIRKEGKEYSVTNAYTTESSVATPKQIAEKTYDENSDIDYDAYIEAIKKQQQEEFKAIYDIQSEARSTQEIKKLILLPITGVSSGVPSNLSSTIIYLNELSKFPGLDVAAILSTIVPKTVDTATFKKGQTTVRINGGEFKINNPKMNEELMSEIAAMLLDPNPPASIKGKYFNQFIDTTRDTTRRIQFNSVNNTIELYKKTSTKNSSGTYTFSKVINRTIDLEKLKNNGYTPQELQDFEKDILQYLREGFQNGPTLININSSLIKGQTEFIRYNRNTEEPYSGDYLEFISSFPAEINLINADPGIYNKSIEFAFPGSFIDDLQKADKNLNNIEEENLTFDEILKRRDEEDAKNPVKVEARDIIAKSKSIEFLNKVKNYPGNTNIKPTDNFLLTAYFKAAIKERNYTKEFANSIKNEILNITFLNPISEEQFKIIQDEIDAIKEVPTPSQVKAEVKDQIEIPGSPDPMNNATISGLFTDNDIDEDIFKGLFKKGSKKEKIARKKVIEARAWWNSPELAPLRKVISLSHTANLVNSNVYASFITNASKIANPDGTLGKITVNKAKGSVFQNLTIYHEAWHGFSQLFLSKKDKIDLYEELRNYTTSKGATPYATKSYLELEEMLAEDFRNYIKTGKAKASSPKRNTLFRRIVEFLKQLFGKGLKKFNNKEVLIDSLNSPMAKELFDKLYIGDINNYTPLIDNSMFYSLDRGVSSVNNKRNVVLSKQDSTLAVSSIDGIFSQILNTINEKAKLAGKTGAKGANIAVFLEPARRAGMYVQARTELESKLKIEKDKLAKTEGVVNFSTLTTLQDIKDNAAGLFKNSEGKDKFIFLKSQIDDFTILEPSLKANGDRVKGEKYHGIKIVSDFYKHKTILNGKVPVDIMVVSSMAQAEEQLKNYKAGESKAYTKVIDYKKPEVLLTEDQEFIQDNIRILQTMLDNYGDETSGLVKYHMENSDFEISKTKYELDVIDENNDESISEDNLEDSGRDIETFNDVKKHKQSLLQMMGKETTMLLKSLIKTDDNGVVKNRLGFPERVDFINVFNIVAKTIGGIRDRELAYELLKAEASKFPEIQQLIDFKYPDPNTKNSYEFDISTQFLQDFGKPKVTYKIVLAVPDEDSGTIDFKIAEASLAISNITSRWQTEFASALPSRYINKTPDNESELDLQQVLTDFSKENELVISKAFDFAKAIGINLTVNDNIKSDFDSKLEYYGIPFMFKTVKDFAQIEEDLARDLNSPNVSSDQRKFLKKFKANPIEILRTNIPINILKSFPKGLNENTQIIRLAELQGKYGYDSATTGVITADGNTAYEDVNYSFMTGFVDAVNSVSNIRDLWTKNEYSHMAYLNPNINTFTKNLRILNEIFDMHTGAKKPGKSLQLMNVNGTSQITEDENGNSNTEGTITAKLDPIGKGLQELHSMLGGGVSEFNRMSEKKNAYGLKVVGGIVGKTDPISYATKGVDTDLYVDVIQFANNGNGEIYAINNHFLGYIQSEFDRIVKFKGNNREEYLNFTGFNNKVNDVNGVEKYAGEIFNDFDDILSKDTQNKLYALADEYATNGKVNIPLAQYLKSDAVLLKDIQTDITNYFKTITQNYKELYFDKLPYISKSILVKAGVPKEKLLTRKQVEEAQEDPKNIETVLKAFMYNDWIHRFEVSSLMFGDRAQWNHGKEEQPKRIPGAQSDGVGFIFDKFSRDFINNVFNKTTETYGAKLTRESEDGTKYDSFQYSDVLNTAVIKDAQRESIYLAEYQAAWKKDYIDINKYSEEEADRLVALDSKPFTKDKMDESDGIAYMTLDAYRTLHKTGRGWSIAQEELYQKVVAGEKITNAKEFFPIYKLHYYGSLKNDLLPAMAMHKFSVAPLIPGVYPENSELGKLHKKMLKDNIQYVTFKSGSKAVTLTKNNDGSVDNLFANSNENSINEDFAFTVNPIFMANLKEVTVINEYYKKTLPIATQTRVIILDNLYNDGKLTNSDNAEIVNSYTDAVRDYSIVLKDELLNKIGYSLNEDGNYEGDITTFVQLLREELGNRDIPEQLLKLLNTTKEGKLSIDLSLHPQAETIEKLLLSIIQTTLIKQQTNGEPLTQMPSTFTNGIWDDQYKTLTDPAKIKRLLGTNTLPFYNINPTTGKTNLMKVAIALQGEYKNLLKAKDLDGNVIGTIDRLNELIKDDKWLEQNRDAISLFGPRIPNDATNTIEGAEVWHFFNESFGNVIILPTEIVAKAGSDYDGDKLFMSMPNIDNDGNYINKGIDNYDALLKETIALEKDGKLGKDRLKSGQLIELQKKYLQNLYLKKSIDLLTLPDNFGYLTKANQTYLVEKYAEDLQKLGTGYNRYESATHAEPKKSTGPKNKQKNVVSPTRQNEISHQLYLHDANLSLEPSLGVQANFTKSHVLYKTVGVNMPATYTTSYTNFSTNKVIKSLVEIPMVMRLKHNTAINEAGKEVISLSGEKTQLGTRITDINSHALNGILDRAKNSFPFDLKLVPEAINTLNYMLQAGVSEEEIFYFLTQPLIVEYIKDQKLRKSPYYTIVYGESKNSKATESANAIIQNIINVKEVDVAPYFDQINLLKLKATLDSYAVKNNKELYNVILLDKRIYKGLTVEYIIDQINKGNINPKTILKIANTKESIFKRLNDSQYLFTDENYAFTTQVFSDKLLPEGSINIDFLKKHIKDSNSPAALALFFNYLELEKQYEGMSELEKVFSPDTSKLTTTQQVVKREDAYANLYENSKVDSASLDRLRKNSVLASFNQDKLILDLVTPLFPLRLSNSISSYINKLFTNPTENRRIRNKFGAGVDGQEFFTKKYQNAIVAYIYQNYMSRFVNADGTLTNIPEYYNDKLTIIDNTIDTNVIVDKYSIIVNSDRIKNEYQKKAYLSTNETEIYIGDVFTKDPFNTLNSYYRYTIEKELLRTQIPIESLEQNKDFLNLLDTYSTADAAYESYISEKALANTYNRSYIIGTSKYSYTEKVLNIIKEFADTNLKDKYPILAQLAPVNTKKAVKLIQLNDKQIAKGTLGEIYINNLINLANPIIKKVDDPIDNQRISDAFKDFSLMMFYQHGVGSSKLGFVNAIDPESYMENITKFSQDFLNNYLKGNENFSGKMEYPYNKNKRLDVKSTTTFDATLAGERTATTRYSDHKAFKYWKNAKVGDIITWDSGDGRTVDVVVTKALAPLVGSGKTAEQWSKLEGWSVDYFNRKVKPKLNTAWQLEYELYKNPLTDIYNMLMAPSNLFGNFEIKDTEDEKSLSKADSLPPLVMPGSKPTSNVKTVSEPYGVVVAETLPSQSKTKEFVSLIQPQIQAQAYQENNTGNKMFMYGLRWTRKAKALKPLNNKSYANKGLPITDAKAKDGYVYDTVDQNGNSLASVSDLQPIITEIEKSLGIDMSNYDAVIGNIYLPGQRIQTHRDTTESLSARNYPVVVYTIGAGNAINVYENVERPGSASFASDKKTSIPTKNGTIYTFGMNGKGRFELGHDTPSAIKKGDTLQPIVLPDGTIIKDYTITLTFRRAADLESGMPSTPKKLTASQPTQTPTISVKNFDKKNLFTVTPIQSADKKAVIKASIATQYIGFGEGIKGSSTESYRQEVGALANTGNYSADDVIFVSIGGKRGTAEQEKTQQDRTIKEAIKAVEAGATILTDNKAYTNASSYNTGEKKTLC
jgi:alkylated DNA repair dioxygenase AlkB